MEANRSLTPAEEERLKTLRDAQPNSWLALDDSGNHCVGRGATLQEAMEDARRHGFDDPVMFHVPSDWTPAVLTPCA